MTVHTGKMEAMLICKHACRPYETTDIWQLHIFHFQIYLLGCSNRPQLELEPQIKMLLSKFGGKLKFLKSMKGLPTCVLEEIYYKGIVPSITYFIAVWGSCSLSLFNDLAHLHKKAAKLIINSPVGLLIVTPLKGLNGSH